MGTTWPLFPPSLGRRPQLRSKHFWSPPNERNAKRNLSTNLTRAEIMNGVSKSLSSIIHAHRTLTTLQLTNKAFRFDHAQIQRFERWPSADYPPTTEPNQSRPSPLKAGPQGHCPPMITDLTSSTKPSTTFTMYRAISSNRFRIEHIYKYK